ncbi:hypothetical protein McpSp1_18180 [Methanocorpusculaceae archaeon Sp1]|uniref:UPF0212 protein McpAg1_09020 n=1 Tax=Methanorbis furvi TaxID=3028299 RepID=A0AAE4SA80_9EURY|nr:hypothetical protein [Methanocorpusculaceae archaeon Sp1]MDV0441694.1 hypothetical protein [Methanocorpusculaceae archaeon Ag1]
MPDYRVTLEAAWTVKDVTTTQDVIGIAVSEAGKRLHPSAKFVDVDVMVMPCPYCGDEINSALVVARTGMVGLLLSMKVFNAEGEDHAERIAKSVIGKAVRDIPLATYCIDTIEGEEHA